jgi:tripartite-type tricarboxylate transporter receptor subunit TctC
MQSTTVITPKVEKYPNKPITIIVPFSAGGGLDLVARSLEKRATQNLGQSIIIVNRPGGAGTTGWNEVVNATPAIHLLFQVRKYSYTPWVTPTNMTM